MALLVEESGKAASAFLKPREAGGPPRRRRLGDETQGHVHDLRPGRRTVVDAIPAGLVGRRRRCRRNSSIFGRIPAPLTGGAAPTGAPEPPADKRFAAPEWRDIPVFDFLRQAYLLTSDWANDARRRGRRSIRDTRTSARFYLRQICERAVAVELRRHQPGTAAGDVRAERRESRARHADAGRGHRGRQRRPQGPPERSDARSSSASTWRRRPARSCSATN